MTLFEQIYFNAHSRHLKRCPRLIDSVRNIRHIFYKRLIEAYQTTDVEWIDDWFDQLYFDVNHLQETTVQKIINASKLICEQHNIILKCVKNNPEAEVGTESVLSTEYCLNSKKIQITIDVPKFLKTFKKGNESLLVELKVYLYDVITHEDTHVQQNKKYTAKNYIQPVSDDPDDPKNDPYYNQKAEISAYARGVARALLALDFDVDKLLRIFTSSSEFKKLLDELIKEYPESGMVLYRFYSNSKKYPKVWNKFRTYVYYFLRSEP